jgi:hypothetical protein
MKGWGKIVSLAPKVRLTNYPSVAILGSRSLSNT